MKRKVLGVLLSIMMLGTCILAGCGQENGTAAPEDSQPAAESTGAADESTQAVSYTHLDVYKRQVRIPPHTAAEYACLYCADRNGCRNHLHALLNYQLQEELSADRMEYLHHRPDVYKRQAYIGAAFLQALYQFCALGKINGSIGVAMGYQERNKGFAFLHIIDRAHFPQKLFIKSSAAEKGEQRFCFRPCFRSFGRLRKGT